MVLVGFFVQSPIQGSYMTKFVHWWGVLVGLKLGRDAWVAGDTQAFLLSLGPPLCLLCWWSFTSEIAWLPLLVVSYNNVLLLRWGKVHIQCWRLIKSPDLLLVSIVLEACHCSCLPRSSLDSCLRRLSGPASTFTTCAGLFYSAGSLLELELIIRDGTLEDITLVTGDVCAATSLFGKVSSGVVVNCWPMLEKMVLSRLRSWICLSPIQFFFPFSAAVRPWATFKIASPSAIAGLVMCLCRKCTVIHTQRAYVFQVYQ